MKNTIIFDLDGLLIDSEIISFQLYCDLAKTYGQHFTMETYIHDYCGKTSLENMQTFIKEFRLPISVEEGLAFTDRREKEYLKKGVNLKPGAGKLLSYLKRRQYQILLASSSTMERAAEILSRNAVSAFFDHMIFGADVQRGKPFPDIFIKARERAGELPERCLVLEDSEAGIQAAYSAGIDVICIPDLKTPGEKYLRMAATELSSLEDVITWLEEHHTA